MAHDSAIYRRKRGNFASDEKTDLLTDPKDALSAPGRKILAESICLTIELLDFMTVRIRFIDSDLTKFIIRLGYPCSLHAASLPN